MREINSALQEELSELRDYEYQRFDFERHLLEDLYEPTALRICRFIALNLIEDKWPLGTYNLLINLDNPSPDLIIGQPLFIFDSEVPSITGVWDSEIRPYEIDELPSDSRLVQTVHEVRAGKKIMIIPAIDGIPNYPMSVYLHANSYAKVRWRMNYLHTRLMNAIEG